MTFFVETLKAVGDFSLGFSIGLLTDFTFFRIYLKIDPSQTNNKTLLCMILIQFHKEFKFHYIR